MTTPKHICIYIFFKLFRALLSNYVDVYASFSSEHGFGRFYFTRFNKNLYNVSKTRIEKRLKSKVIDASSKTFKTFRHFNGLHIQTPYTHTHAHKHMSTHTAFAVCYYF